jgi:two-component sensor histidine kinase
MMNSKGCGRKQSWLDFSYHPKIYLQMLARRIKNNLKIISILVKNQTDHLTSTIQKHCNWS